MTPISIKSAAGAKIVDRRKFRIKLVAEILAIIFVSGIGYSVDVIGIYLILFPKVAAPASSPPMPRAMGMPSSIELFICPRPGPRMRQD
jgi:hypothetical protein